MSDDAPLEPVTPEPVTQPGEAVVPDAPPTETVPASTPPGPPPWTAPPGGGDISGPARSSTVAVPKWLLLVVAAIVFAAVGFGVGYAVAPGDDDSVSAPTTAPNPFNGNGNNGENGNLPTIPVPSPDQLRGAFLGVLTAASTDPAGARVSRVVPDSPASDIGLKADDVITKVDGKAVANPSQLATEIRGHSRGDTVKITFVRAGETKTEEVKLATRSGLQLPTPSTTAPRQ